MEDLELEISKATTLESALTEFCSNEKLCDTNAYYCEKCKKKTVASRRFFTHSFTRAFTHLLTHSLTYSLTYSLTHSLTHSLRLLLNRIPSVLSIQLKRFGYSNNAEPRKLTHFVKYPEVLQLHQYLNINDEGGAEGVKGRKTRNSTISRNANNSTSVLNLFAVIVHYGTHSLILTYLLADIVTHSLTHSFTCLLTHWLIHELPIGAHISNGHYVAYIKCNNEWHRTDDGHVSPCSSHEALDQNAYILFYTRSDIDIDQGIPSYHSLTN